MRGVVSRTRSVSEVGSRPGPESLYRLDTEEIWDVIESNWAEVITTPPSPYSLSLCITVG
jgi:hypothetical protein